MIEQSTSRSHANLALIGWLALCFAVGGIASIFAARAIPTWYAALVKPPLNPPNHVFGPVWTVLYTLMAVSAWIVWKTRPSPCRRRGLRLFLVQLGLNLLWTWIFFGAHQTLTAFVDLAALWAAILLTILTFKKMSHTAAWLLAPYLAWVTFAGYLNFAIWKMN
ncbi:MAG TPA: TspO/MBR family protein [Silvibacterium sp.]|nr:TspO/MBR family protein [Silvibacterium sp.]